MNTIPVRQLEGGVRVPVNNMLAAIFVQAIMAANAQAARLSNSGGPMLPPSKRRPWNKRLRSRRAGRGRA